MEKNNFYVKHIMEKTHPCLGHNFPTMNDWKELIKQKQYITTDQLFILLSYMKRNSEDYLTVLKSILSERYDIDNHIEYFLYEELHIDFQNSLMNKDYKYFISEDDYYQIVKLMITHLLDGEDGFMWRLIFIDIKECTNETYKQQLINEISVRGIPFYYWDEFSDCIDWRLFDYYQNLFKILYNYCINDKSYTFAHFKVFLEKDYLVKNISYSRLIYKMTCVLEDITYFEQYIIKLLQSKNLISQTYKVSNLQTIIEQSHLNYKILYEICSLIENNPDDFCFQDIEKIIVAIIDYQDKKIVQKLCLEFPSLFRKTFNIKQALKEKFKLNIFFKLKNKKNFK